MHLVPRPRRRVASLVGCALALVFALTPARPAAACGASPGGPMGHAMCGLDDGPLEHRFRGAMSYAFSSTRLTFEGQKFGMLRQSTVVTLDYRLDKKSALTFGAGGFLAGRLRSDAAPSGASDSTMSGGPAALLGYSVSMVREAKLRPFAVLTIAGSFVHAQTRALEPLAPYAGYTAFDLRTGALVGKTFFDDVSVYAVGRLFGGPAFWRIDGQSRVGTDLYHYQVGGGVILRLPAGLELFAEGVPLGERGVVAGMGLTP